MSTKKEEILNSIKKAAMSAGPGVRTLFYFEINHDGVCVFHNIEGAPHDLLFVEKILSSLNAKKIEEGLTYERK